MKIKKFWVVTRPTPNSELADICFETDINGLQLQFNGGLQIDEIHALYTEAEEAKTAALWLLSKRSRPRHQFFDVITIKNGNEYFVGKPEPLDPK